LEAICRISPAYAVAVANGLGRVQDQEEFQAVVEDVPLASGFLKDLQRLRTGVQ
jgi:hypothetical protein